MGKKVIISIYFNKNRDADLRMLCSQVGSKTFSRICKYAFEALIVPELGIKARQLCNKKLEVEEEPVDCVRISLTSAGDEPLRKLLKHIQSRKKSIFIKQVIRYTLGASITLPLFLESNFRSELSAPVTYTAQFVMSGDMAKPTRKQRRKTVRRVVKTVDTIEIPKVEDITSAKEPETSISGIFTSSNIPEDNNTSDMAPGNEADEILAMLNNMLG